MKNILDIHTNLINNTIKVKKKRLNKVVRNYSFYYFDTELDFDQNENDNEIYQRINESNVIIIGLHTEVDSYFIVSYEKTIICVKVSLMHLLHSLFSYNDDLNILFLSDSKVIFNKYISFRYNEVEFRPNFEEEISNFNRDLDLKMKSSIERVWRIVQRFISGYLIEKSYLKLKQNRIENFYLNKMDSTILSKKFEEKEYIEIRKAGSGSLCHISLIYHIEKEELLCIKQIYNTNVNKYLTRETENYSLIKHEFIPTFYGTTKANNFIVIEFINGKTLVDIEKLHLTEKEKYSIIFQLMSVFKYLHEKHFIYRDLKPSNIMIDINKTITLIDFDNMIKEDNINYDNDNDLTKDFSIDFVSPEILSGNPTTKSDIYSIGQMIFYIINEKYPSNESSNKFVNYRDIKLIYDQCTNENYEKRPNISELITLFSKYIINKNIILENIAPNDLYQLGLISETENKIEESIQYFLLAADQNSSDAQFYLGVIYCKGEYIE